MSQGPTGARQRSGKGTAGAEAPGQEPARGLGEEQEGQRACRRESGEARRGQKGGRGQMMPGLAGTEMRQEATDTGGCVHGGGKMLLYF